MVVVVLGALLVEAPAGGARGPRRAEPRPPEVGCEACIVVSDTGETLFRRRPKERLPIASTTKLVTALLVVDAGALDEDVVVSPSAAATGGGGLALEAGEAWPVESLLYALLLSSSNDAAVALAEHVAGSQAAFVAAMNARARRLGLENTRFETPHGLDSAGHYSTVGDLSEVAYEVLDDPLLTRIVATSRAAVEGPQGTVSIDNRNLLLESYRGAIGIKTGYTLGAGNALVAAARRGGRTLVSVVLRSLDSFADSAALLDYGFARLSRAVVLRRGETVGSIVLDPAGAVRAVAARTVRSAARAASITVDFGPSRVALPVGEGDFVGAATVRSGHRVLDRVDVVASGDLAAGGGSWAAEGLATVLSWGRWMAGAPT